MKTNALLSNTRITHSLSLLSYNPLSNYHKHEAPNGSTLSLFQIRINFQKFRRLFRKFTLIRSSVPRSVSRTSALECDAKH